MQSAREKEAEARSDVTSVMRALAVGVSCEEHNARVEQLERTRHDAQAQARNLAAELAKSKKELVAGKESLARERREHADVAAWMQAEARAAVDQVEGSLKVEVVQARSLNAELAEKITELERKLKLSEEQQQQQQQQQKTSSPAEYDDGAAAAAADDDDEADDESHVSRLSLFAEGLEDALIIFAVGGAESGVSSLCERAAAEFDVTVLRVADIIEAEVAAGTELGEEMLASLTAGKFLTSATLVELVLKHMKKTLVVDNAGGEDEINNNNETTFLIEGFPTNTDQALAFEEATARKPALTVGVMDGSMQPSEAAVLEMYSSRRADEGGGGSHGPRGGVTDCGGDAAGYHCSIAGWEDVAEDDAYAELVTSSEIC